MTMTDPSQPGEEAAAAALQSPFATRPAELDDKTVDALLRRLRDAAKKPAAPPPTPPQPRALSRVNWDDLRVKGWHLALLLASAYVSARPDKVGWLAPVITAAAGSSKPPTVSFKGAVGTAAGGLAVGLVLLRLLP